MKNSSSVLVSTRAITNVGLVVKIVSVVSLGVIVFTWFSVNPFCLQGEEGLTGYSSRGSAVNESVGCDCGMDHHRVVEHESGRKKNVSILLGVLTVAKKVERRNVIRLAYGVQRSETADVTVVFVIGRPKSEGEKLAVALEVLRYGDILILDCEENMNRGKSFHYFSTVAALGIRYDYVMKMDDDSYVRMENLAKSLDPLPRTDLYYGFALPCGERNPYAGRGYMAGMGYLISWDIVQWLHSSPEVRNNTEGTEDKLLGEWLKAGGKGKNRVSPKPLFYDHPEYQGTCAHALIPETILIHQVKNDKRWFDVLSFFEGDRIADAIAPGIISQPSTNG